MKRKYEFCPGDRYRYDYMLCPQGYAQIDTDQDAPYFGAWANPKTLVIFQYIEGDCYTTTCETASEFTTEIEHMANWNKDQGHFFGIDPGLRDGADKPWRELGLGKFLH